AIPVGDEALQGANRDRLIDRAAAACHFAGRSADASANGSQRIGTTRDAIRPLVIAGRNSPNVSSGVGVDRAGVLTLDLPAPVFLIRSTCRIAGRRGPAVIHR